MINFYKSYFIEAKKTLFPDKPTICRTFACIGILLLWYPTCLISYIKERRFVFVSNYLFHNARHPDHAAVPMLVILLLLLIFLILGIFNKKLLSIVIAVAYVDVGTTVLFARHTNWLDWRTWSEPGTLGEYSFWFISQILPTWALDYPFIGEIYYSVVTYGICIVFIVGLRDFSNKSNSERYE